MSTSSSSGPPQPAPAGNVDSERFHENVYDDSQHESIPPHQTAATATRSNFNQSSLAPSLPTPATLAEQWQQPVSRSHQYVPSAQHLSGQSDHMPVVQIQPHTQAQDQGSNPLMAHALPQPSFGINYHPSAPPSSQVIPTYPYLQAPSNPQTWHQQPAPRQRTAIACSYCRRRKIRCSGFEQAEDGKCTNCRRTKQLCVFTPVALQSSVFSPAHAVHRGQSAPPSPFYSAHGVQMPMTAATAVKQAASTNASLNSDYRSPDHDPAFDHASVALAPIQQGSFQPLSHLPALVDQAGAQPTARLFWRPSMTGETRQLSPSAEQKRYRDESHQARPAPVPPIRPDANFMWHDDRAIGQGALDPLESRSTVIPWADGVVKPARVEPRDIAALTSPSTPFAFAPSPYKTILEPTVGPHGPDQSTDRLDERGRPKRQGEGGPPK